MVLGHFADANRRRQTEASPEATCPESLLATCLASFDSHIGCASFAETIQTGLSPQETAWDNSMMGNLIDDLEFDGCDLNWCPEFDMFQLCGLEAPAPVAWPTTLDAQTVNGLSLFVALEDEDGTPDATNINIFVHEDLMATSGRFSSSTDHVVIECGQISSSNTEESELGGNVWATSWHPSRLVVKSRTLASAASTVCCRIKSGLGFHLGVGAFGCGSFTPPADATPVDDEPAATPEQPEDCDVSTVRGCCPTQLELDLALSGLEAWQCFSSGDPHIRQFDGFINHAQDEGDFWFYKSPPLENGLRELEIATRHRAPDGPGGSGTVTGNQAYSISGELLGGNTFQFHGGIGGNPNIAMWNGEEIELSEICDVLEDYVCTCDSYAIWGRQRRITLQFERYKFVSRVFAYSHGWMNIHISVPKELASAFPVTETLVTETLISLYPNPVQFGAFGTCTTSAGTGAQHGYTEQEIISCDEDPLTSADEYCNLAVPATESRRRLGFDEVLAQCSEELKEAAEGVCGSCGAFDPELKKSCMFDACAMGADKLEDGISAAKGTNNACRQQQINNAATAEAKALLCEPGEVFDQNAQDCVLPEDEGEEDGPESSEGNPLGWPEASPTARVVLLAIAAVGVVGIVICGAVSVPHNHGRTLWPICASHDSDRGVERKADKRDVEEPRTRTV